MNAYVWPYMLQSPPMDIKYVTSIVSRLYAIDLDGAWAVFDIYNNFILCKTVWEKMIKYNNNIVV